MTEAGHVLTWRQRQILQVIRESVQEHGYPPSMREIGAAVGLSSMDSIRYQLAVLQRRGHLSRVIGRPRAITLASLRRSAFGFPSDDLAGKTVMVPIAGQASEELTVNALPMPKQVVGEGDLFVVHVADDAMRGVAVMAGDLVVAERQPQIQNGLVVASAAGELVVRELDGEWLLPRHPDFLPRRLSAETEVLGRIVAVLRYVPLVKGGSGRQ